MNKLKFADMLSIVTVIIMLIAAIETSPILMVFALIIALISAIIYYKVVWKKKRYTKK